MALVDTETTCKNKGQNKGQNKGLAREIEIDTEIDIDIDIDIDTETEAFGYHTISLRSIVFSHFRCARNDTQDIRLYYKIQQSL